MSLPIESDDQNVLPAEETDHSSGDIYLHSCEHTPDELQQLLDEFTVRYNIMENEIKRIINEHIPTVIRKLTNEQQYMDRWHKVTNAVTIGGAAAGVAGLFIPVVGGGVAIAGSIVVIAALLLDLWGQKQTKKVTKALQEEFERNCQPAREAYEALMQLFYNFCVEYVKHNPDSPPTPEIAATPNYVSSSKALQQAKLPALQSVSCGAALGDLATTITSIAIDIEENSTKFLSVIQKVIPIAGTVASTTAMLGGICSRYVLLDTLFNFLKPCRASQDIKTHIEKLKNFEVELKHLLDKSKLGKMLMKSETSRIQAEKQIYQLRKEITNLLPYKNQYEKNDTHTKSTASHTRNGASSIPKSEGTKTVKSTI